MCIRDRSRNNNFCWDCTFWLCLGILSVEDGNTLLTGSWRLEKQLQLWDFRLEPRELKRNLGPSLPARGRKNKEQHTKE
eukprot:1302087-Amphidinium_carterae.1